MRKIESAMVAAIKDGKDWHHANTATEKASDAVIVRLHGNKIAEVGDNFVRLFDGGWRTATTKSRLNAILAKFGLPGEGVYQKAGVWYVNQASGPIPFVSGMRLN
jgi:hypothetical protein